MVFLLAGCAASVDTAVRPEPEMGLTARERHAAGETTLAVISWPKEREEAEEEGGEPELEFGPPPPGYVKITAQPVPGWTPESMHPGGTDGAGWTLLGPAPITNEYWSGSDNASGRVVSIAVDPTNPARVYIGSASGGVWKTTNSGGSWAPLTDELSILTHGAVAIDPTNPSVIYAGTGEYSSGSGGDGLFKSLDGGASWTRVATTAQVGDSTSRIIVDPQDPQRVFLAGGAGCFRSTDGGATWSQRLGGSCSDLALNPVNPQIVYAGRANDGVYRSLDGGNTFSKVWPSPANSNTRRIALSLCASTPSTIYCAITNPSNGLLGFYRSTNDGANWTQLTNTPDFPSPQGWYDLAVAVSPTDPNLVFCGGVSPEYAPAGIIRSTDGGSTWTETMAGGEDRFVHPDVQTLAFGPDGALWVGCDGGVWRSTNNGATWINCNATLTLAQNYALAPHPTDTGRMIGGTQDNGTIQRTTSNAWPQIFSGDGGYAAYDASNPARRYVTYVYLSVYRQFAGNTTEISGPWGNDPRNFISPLIMDPNSPQTLLGGTNRVWRTTNADSTHTWAAISGTDVSGGGVLNTIAVARGAPNTIYTGSSSGRVYVTTNGSTWVNRTAGLPSGDVSDIEISPTDPATAYATFYNTSGGRIFRTVNAGQSWANMTGTLPAGVSVKCIALDWRSATPGMWVGSGAGVYSSYDGGATWAKDGSDLPNVIVDDLLINPATSTLTAGTYGRGTWRLTLPSLPQPCYANCDASTAAPALNVLDFNCFLNRFAAGESYANCDASTVAPVLNVLDFNCFLNAFSAGCE
jgi:photosystem II stability/assembly factor-like uncharacterized protein